ncbi:E3 ubiquitin-protein ligase RNF126 [Denticeps clupeoides]|uniref:E3 ubiquitin-protein ligase RNF126 n=1 Tax=Denticeps clupeoides TaxID=299321 RepID=UPI0010A39CF9|nr:E3 ubiquitin-protein ligase RNF126-like [Denticeps clupeoides]
MDAEEEDDHIFTTWMSDHKEPEPDPEPDPAPEPEQAQTPQRDLEVERKSSLNLPRPGRVLATRRASLPCPATLNAMQLSHLRSTQAPSPASHLIRMGHDGRPHPRPHPWRSGAKGEDDCPKANSTPERRPPPIPTILEVTEPQEKKSRFRSRNVMSLSDADSICLICHDDLHKGGGGVRELHCTHSFHSECIEEWLWRKQACPTCRVHVVMPEPLYWTSTRVKVP